MSTARAAYYLLLITLLMPALPDGQQTGQSAMRTNMTTVQQTASAATGYSSTFCVEQQNLCNATSYLLRKLEAKAMYPIQLLSDWSVATSLNPGESQA